MLEIKNYKILFVEDDKKMLENEQEDINEINSFLKDNLFESDFLLIPADLSSNYSDYKIIDAPSIQNDILKKVNKIVEEYINQKIKYLVVVDMELVDHNDDDAIRFVGKKVCEDLQKNNINSILVSAVSDPYGPTIVRPNPNLWKGTYCRKNAAISMNKKNDIEELNKLNKLIEVYSESFLLRKQYLSQILYEFVKKNFN